MSKHKVYVIILNYNSWEDTIECLESVMKCEYSNYQVVIVDNCSTNRSMDFIRDWCEGTFKKSIGVSRGQLIGLSQPYEKKPIQYVLYNDEDSNFEEVSNFRSSFSVKNPIVLIQAKKNGGFSAGNNIGMKYALLRGDGEFLWLLNNDTVVERDSLSKLVQYAESVRGSDLKVGMIGSKILFYDDPLTLQGVGGVYNKWIGFPKHLGRMERDKGQYDSSKVTENIDYPMGASLFLDSRFVHDVGMLEEKYFLYFEELDWTLRGRQHGWAMGYCWKSKVYHKVGKTAGSAHSLLYRNPVADYWAVRNRFVMTREFFPHYIIPVRLVALCTFFRRLIFLRWKHAFVVGKALLGL